MAANFGTVFRQSFGLAKERIECPKDIFFYEPSLAVLVIFDKDMPSGIIIRGGSVEGVAGRRAGACSSYIRHTRLLHTATVSTHVTENMK